MSKLYGQVEPDTRSEPAHRRANERIEVWAQTTQGRVTVELWADGEYRVSVNKVSGYSAIGPDRVVHGGNVNALDTQERK